jgi:DNA-binding GntR family transcriptional regulator
MTPDAIAEQIGRAIREGEYAEGAPLIQEELGRRFGVSRNPIREALRLLEARGLVEIRGGGGAVVRTHSEDDIVELYTLRKALEPTIAEAVVDGVTGRAIAQLTTLVDQMTSDIETREWMALNYAFHEQLYLLADRPRTASILTSLLSAVQPYSRRNIEDLGGRARADAEHREILDALRRRDPAAFGALLVAHMEGAEERLVPHADRA